jgi:hypothetical protein
MANYDNVAPWVVVLVVVFSIWRAFHGPYSDEVWQSFKQSVRHRLARKQG